MILEEQRFLHEDLERLEQGISDRVAEDPKQASSYLPETRSQVLTAHQVRERLNRDHQIAGFLDRIQDQSKRLLEIYKDSNGERSKEIQSISTGEPLEEFYKQLGEIKTFHQKYPNEPVENLERAYKKRTPLEGETMTSEIDNMFTGEEGFGRFFDLTTVHDLYLNLPGIKRLTYLQYLDAFDIFVPPYLNIKRPEKMTVQYYTYVTQLAEYLEGFMRRTKPLENLEKLFISFEEDFEKAWNADEVAGWKLERPAPATGVTGEGTWCADCEKEFKNDNVYKAHLTAKKHLKAAERRKAREINPGADASGAAPNSSLREKERKVAEREYRCKRLAAAMSQERSDTKVNVERKQGMTERERQMEQDALFAPSSDPAQGGGDSDSDSDDDEKIYNPLKLPLAWDGKPIPFWLYKLHGLGVEFRCEICGNYVYMGRRAFDKHFNEPRHIYGLKCLGITNTTLFREITGIDDARKLWAKIQSDKKKSKTDDTSVVQMEDAEGNVMPEKVYYDLQKQGLL